MTRPGRDWDEASLSERPAIELLESLGYAYVKPEAMEAERQSFKEVVIEGRLSRALKKLNPWMTDANVKKAIRTVTNVSATSLIEANEKVHTALTYGIALEQDRGGGKKGHSVRFFDFDNIKANEFVVTRQFKVLGTSKHIIADVVVLVNGIPLAIMECKSPTVGDKWQGDATGQLVRYEEADASFRGQGAPKLFEPVQLIIAACGEHAVYGTVGTVQRFFYEWPTTFPRAKDDLERELGRTFTVQDTLLAGLLSPANLLDILRNFVVFETENGRTVRKVCRYKQYIAVNRALDRIAKAKKPTERGGVIWHTQGSGKSLSMLWIALKLRRNPSLQNPTIAIVTDRRDLDRQITTTFENCGFPNPERATSVANLRELLSHPTGKTLMTTVQKFQDATSRGGRDKSKRGEREEHPVLSEAGDIFVLVDECHRSQYKGLAANMRRALPNACFLGFTGTPIDKNDRSTLQTFGSYIDTYTIEQAVADKATVPIYYEARLPELRIIGNNLDAIFDRVFVDRSEDERAAIKRRYATEEAIAGAPRRIELICLDLIDHFQKFIRPNGFKAQVVAVSRDVAATFKETLNRLHAPESALIMSGTNDDEARLAKWHLRKDQQDRLIERFKDKDDPLCILVVCDMLLTGFDAPAEQVMYLDSPLKEHTLLQAIARVNRTAAGKDYGLVIDYWGVSDDLQAALAIFSSTDVKGALTAKADELPRLEQRHQAALRYFQKVADKSDLHECVAVLEPEDVRADFDQAFRRFSQSMDMMLPDPRALRFIGDLKWLGKIRQAARARYHDPRLDISDCGAKVRELIEQAVQADGIRILVKEVPLFSKDFESKLKHLKSDEARASEMEHAVRHEITVHLDENPAFFQTLRERLEEIIKQRRAQRLSAAQQLELLKAIVRDIGGVHDTAHDMGLSDLGYAVYGVLEMARPVQAAEARAPYNVANRDLASLVTEAMAGDLDVLDWHVKDDVQREMRSKIKRQLRAAGFAGDDVERLAAGMVDLAKARTAR
ncbi:MAG: type I restriction endonuclease subunit R [Deltaproteobacteria bacterium]|nr:type I restriction endonuclease subunit R [Deltaproteobacteria bacterium]